MDETAPDAVRNEFSLNAWASVHLFAEVLATLDTIDAASLMAALDGYDGRSRHLAAVHAGRAATTRLGLPRIFTACDPAAGRRRRRDRVDRRLHRPVDEVGRVSRQLVTELLRFVVLGLGVGAIYTLTAQGLVLIYRGSGVVNFAQGGLAMIGAFVYYRGTGEYGWPTWVGWLVALAVPAVLGVLTHLLVMARLRRASSLVRLVATLGLLFLMIAVATELWGSTGDPVRSPLADAARACRSVRDRGSARTGCGSS